MAKYSYRRAWSKIRSVNIKIGFLLSCAFVLFAFQITVEEKEPVIPEGPIWETSEVFYNQRTFQKERILPPPEKLIEKKPTIEIPEEFLIDESFEDDYQDEIDFSENDFIDDLPIIESVNQKSAPKVQPQVKEEDPILIFTDNMPVFGEDCKALINEKERKTCSEKSIMNFISSKVRYSSLAKDINLEGKVVTKFVIDKEGHVTDVEILRGLGAGLDKEVLRVIQLMPDWEPGKQNFKPVKVQMIIPVKFELN